MKSASIVFLSNKVRKSSNGLIVRQSQQTSDRDILINSIPMDSNATTNQFPLLALFIGSIVQTRKPIEGSANFATIGKTYMYSLRIKIEAFCLRCLIG